MALMGTLDRTGGRLLSGVFVNGALVGLLLCNEIIPSDGRSVSSPHHRVERSANGTNPVNDEGNDSSSNGRLVALIVIFFLLLLLFCGVATITYCYFRRGRQLQKKNRRSAINRGRNVYDNPIGPRSGRPFSEEACTDRQNGTSNRDPFCVMPQDETNNNGKKHKKYQSGANGINGSGPRHTSLTNGHLSPIDEDNIYTKKKDDSNKEEKDKSVIDRRSSAPSSMAKLAKAQKDRDNALAAEFKQRRSNILPPLDDTTKSKLPPVDDKEKGDTKPKPAVRKKHRERKYSEQGGLKESNKILKVHQSDSDIRKSVEMEEFGVRKRRHSIDILHTEKGEGGSGPVPIEKTEEDVIAAALEALGMDPLGKPGEDKDEKKTSLRNRRSSAPNPVAEKKDERKRLIKSASVRGRGSKESLVSNDNEKRAIKGEKGEDRKSGDERRRHRRRHHGDKPETEEERKKRHERRRREHRRKRKEEEEGLTEEEKQERRKQRRKEREKNLTEEQKEEIRRKRRHRRHRQRHKEVRESQEGNSIMEEPEEDNKSDGKPDEDSDEGHTSAWDTSEGSDSDEGSEKKGELLEPKGATNRAYTGLQNTPNPPYTGIQDKAGEPGGAHHYEEVTPRQTPRRHSDFVPAQKPVPPRRPSDMTPMSTICRKILGGQRNANSAWATDESKASMASQYTYVTDNFESVDLAPYLPESFEYDA